MPSRPPTGSPARTQAGLLPNTRDRLARIVADPAPLGAIALHQEMMYY